MYSTYGVWKQLWLRYFWVHMIIINHICLDGYMCIPLSYGRKLHKIHLHLWNALLMNHATFLDLWLNYTTYSFFSETFRKHWGCFCTSCLTRRPFLTDLVCSSQSVHNHTLLKYSGFSAKNDTSFCFKLSQIFCQRCCLWLLCYNTLSLKCAHFSSLNYLSFTCQKSGNVFHISYLRFS